MNNCLPQIACRQILNSFTSPFQAENSQRLRSLLGLGKIEFLMGLRTVFYWIAFAAILLFLLKDCAIKGTKASLAGFLLQKDACFGIGFLAIFWMAMVSCRDHLLQTEELVWSKPQPTETIILGRFCGNFALMLFVLLGGTVVAVSSQTLLGGMDFSALAYLHAFWDTMFPLFSISVMSYSLSLIFATPIAGVLVALYWIATLAGRDYVSRIFNLTLPQNIGVYLLLALGMGSLALLLYQKQRRGTSCWRVDLALAAIIFLVVGLRGAAVKTTLAHDPPMHLNAMFQAMEGQTLKLDDRAPGFSLPDQEGRILGLKQFAGKCLVIGLWSPDSRDSFAILDLLQSVTKRYPEGKVIPLALCISENHLVSSHVAKENGYRFPMVTDLGARTTQNPSEGSPLAQAYQVTDYPKIVITNGRRIVRWTETIKSTEAFWPALEKVLNEGP